MFFCVTPSSKHGFPPFRTSVLCFYDSLTKMIFVKKKLEYFKILLSIIQLVFVKKPLEYFTIFLAQYCPFEMHNLKLSFNLTTVLRAGDVMTFCETFIFPLRFSLTTTDRSVISTF